MTIVELTEDFPIGISRNELDDATAFALHADPRFELDYQPQPAVAGGFRYRLRSRGWIGHIPVGSALIIARPKVPVIRVFRMLEAVYDLRSFALLEGRTGVEGLADFYERIATTLARCVLDRARRGLFQAYLERREDLGCVRGRVDVGGSRRRRAAGGSPRLLCEFEELTADLADNQILLWTLYTVSHSAGLTRETARQQVRRAFRALAGTVTLKPKRAQDCLARTYHRLNDDYRAMHGLCRFLLELAGPDVGRGGHEFTPFAIHAPTLFEAFVARWLERHLPPRELSVRAQHHARLRSTAALAFKIDLVLRDARTGAPRAVLDTKYKADEIPTEADLHQIVAYAVEIGVEHAFLVYPSAATRPFAAQVGRIRVRSLVFDLAQAPDIAGAAFLENLRHHIGF